MYYGNFQVFPPGRTGEPRKFCVCECARIHAVNIFTLSRFGPISNTKYFTCLSERMFAAKLQADKICAQDAFCKTFNCYRLRGGSKSCYLAFTISFIVDYIACERCRKLHFCIVSYQLRIILAAEHITARECMQEDLLVGTVSIGLAPPSIIQSCMKVTISLGFMRFRSRRGSDDAKYREVKWQSTIRSARCESRSAHIGTPRHFNDVFESLLTAWHTIFTAVLSHVQLPQIIGTSLYSSKYIRKYV